MKLMKLKNLTAISTQPIQNFKQEQIKEIMSKQATFKPKINKTSKMIVEKKIEEIGGTVQDIYNKETIRRKKFQNMLEEKNKQINENMTFTPRINKKKGRSSSFYPNDEDYEQIKEDLEYKQSIRQKVQEEVKRRKEEAELSECTFKPKISNLNPKTFEEPSRPSNFEKEIGRMRYAYYEKMKRKQKIEKVPVGENYEYIKSLPINPPKCATNYIIRTEEPFVFLDVNVGGGKSGRIGLKPDDDPYLKAREFAVAFQLNQEMETGLAALLCEQLEVYWEEHAIEDELLDRKNIQNKY